MKNQENLYEVTVDVFCEEGITAKLTGTIHARGDITRDRAWSEALLQLVKENHERFLAFEAKYFNRNPPIPIGYSICRVELIGQVVDEPGGDES